MGSHGGGGSSIYGLTLDEVQTQSGNLGKPLCSMNIDELLRSVGDLDHAPARPLSGEISKKTVNEVWREIRSEECGSGNGNGNGDGGDDSGRTEGGLSVGERKPMLGEVTLEDFLVKAGIVAEIESHRGDKGYGESQVDVCLVVTGTGTGTSANLPQCVRWMQNPVTVFSLPMAMDVVPPASLLAEPPLHGQNVVVARDRTIQRRRERMIKNRESAARSRARKQAYTHELEHKVSLLEEENALLRRQMEVEQMFPCKPPDEPKTKLRRTSSTPFLMSPPSITGF